MSMDADTGDGMHDNDHDSDHDGAPEDPHGHGGIEVPGLHEACAELAHVVLAAGQPSVSRDILETLAHRFEREAADFAMMIAGAGRDTALLARAVRYIIDAHALPLMGTDMEWFRQTLACLVELAVPGIALSEAGGAFLRDVRDGIEQSLGDLEG